MVVACERDFFQLSDALLLGVSYLRLVDYEEEQCSACDVGCDHIERLP